MSQPLYHPLPILGGTSSLSSSLNTFLSPSDFGLVLRFSYHIHTRPYDLSIDAPHRTLSPLSLLTPFLFSLAPPSKFAGRLPTLDSSRSRPLHFRSASASFDLRILIPIYTHSLPTLLRPDTLVPILYTQSARSHLLSSFSEADMSKYDVEISNRADLCDR